MITKPRGKQNSSEESISEQIKNGELAEITLTDGTTIHTETVSIKANGWIQVGRANREPVPSHYPAHVVDEIHGRKTDSDGNRGRGPVRYQSPHGRV